MFPKRIPYRNQKIKDSARGEDCTLNLQGCSYNPEETVWAHSDYAEDGKGTSQKADDLFGCYACYNCHGKISGEIKSIYSRDERRDRFHRAMKKSQRILLDKGVIK